MDPQSRLGQFLADLTTDSNRMALFESSPSEAQRLMDEAGLNAEEQRVLASRNVDAVSDELSRHAAKTNGNNGPTMGPGKPPHKPPKPHKPKKRGPAKRGPAKRGPAKRGPAKRGPAKRGSAKRGSVKRGARKTAAGRRVAKRGTKRGRSR